MKELKYQQRAVKELVEKTVKLMSLSGSRRKVVFMAPTGAGKTVMSKDMLERLYSELHDNGDSTLGEVAFIWIAPNALHEQSYEKMKTWFKENHELNPVKYDELDTSANGYIHSGDILFLNWQSINSDKNVIVNESESMSSLYEITSRTQEEHGIPIVVIIDEEHLFAGRMANQSEKVLKRIDAKVEIRISATPVTVSPDEMVTVQREEVVKEEMIKEGVMLNPALEFSDKEETLDEHLIRIALEKRDELAEANRKLGVNINPLLLVQLPNDKENMDDEDKKIKDTVTMFLNLMRDTNVDNGKLAIWLSNEKANLEGISKPDSMVNVLLFKQAIALGWDCPRAAVLLIFRKLESFTFTVQTVGRILRMPEQKFYTDDRLNKGYVYTNISKEYIEIVKDDMNYISRCSATRRYNLSNVLLKSEYCERPATERNRLGSKFKKYLKLTFHDKYGTELLRLNLFDDKVEPTQSASLSNREKLKNKIRFDVNNIVIDVVKDAVATGELGTIHSDKKAQHINTMTELNMAFHNFCSEMIGGMFEKVSVTTLDVCIREVMGDLFDLFYTDVPKVVLYHANKPRFADIISHALKRYQTEQMKSRAAKAEKSYTEYDWEVPAERLYNEQSYVELDNVKNHAMMPYWALQKSSNPEREFTKFLEENTEYIDWWYKNGDAGKQHYAIGYRKKDGTKALFYVDFVIRMKNGQVFLFDTKSWGSDVDGVEKHNALIDYINNPENKGKNLIGGIIIQDRKTCNWMYSPMKIADTENSEGWNSFYPSDYKE